jgi:hypothetical protein
MAKKPKTIGYYQKKVKHQAKEIKVYQNTLTYLVDAESPEELNKRMKEYREILGFKEKDS